MGVRNSATNGVPSGVLGRGFRRGAGVAGGSKYGAKPSFAFDGRKFPSKAERDRYHDLLQLRASNEIADLELQPRWTFEINGRPLTIGTRVVRYTADFRYRRTADGVTVVEDVKGMIARDVELRLALMRAVHGIDVQLIRKGRKT